MTAKVELKGFQKLADAFAPGKFEKRLKSEVAKATRRNALIAEGAIKRGINKGKGIKKNSEFTAAIKGSTRPLVRTGELVKSVVGRAVEWDTLVVGVLKSRMVTDKDGKVRDVLSIAQILHNGATIKVTPKMRRYFFWKASQYEKGIIKEPWRPLSARTKVIRIPRRPFLKFAVRKSEQRKYKDAWGEAVQRALTEGW